MLKGLNKIVVWGFGIEGRDTLKWIDQNQFSGQVVILDQNDHSDVDCKNISATFTTDLSVLQSLDSDDLVIKSPGISAYGAEYRSLKSRNVQITSNTDLGLAIVDTHRCIGVTGTKGKSTTVAMIAHILHSLDRPAIVCGNYGVPLLGQIDAPSDTVFIIELSSYQIVDLKQFPALRLLTNISEDHLDWHLNTQNYQKDKLRLIAKPNDGMSFINAKDSQSVALADHLKNISYYNTGTTIHFKNGAFYDGATRLETPTIFQQEPPYYVSNICGALSMTAQLGVKNMDAILAMESFKGLKHRQEIIGTRHGVQFVNDSISTVPVAAMAAIERFSSAPIRLILGGFDRGVDYDEFIQKLAEVTNLKIYLYGAAGKRIHQLANAHPTIDAFFDRDFSATVKKADDDASSGDTVLLSPAAASYDAFKNFQERGDCFRALCGF